MNHDDKLWRIIHSEYLIKRPWLTARRDHIRMPNGTENEADPACRLSAAEGGILVHRVVEDVQGNDRHRD